MTSTATARTPSASEDTRSSRKTLVAPRLPRLKQHIAEVVKDGKFLVISFEDGPTTQGLNRAEALHMAEDVLASLADRHPDNYNAKFLGRDRLVVWDMVDDDAGNREKE